MTTGTDYSTVAGGERLRVIEAGTPGCRKIGRGQGFTCLSEHWKPVNDRILATGRDQAGRRRYIHHPDSEVVRDEVILAGGP